jgi:hypothetical protein
MNNNALKPSTARATALLRDLEEIERNIQESRSLEAGLISQKLAAQNGLIDAAASSQTLDAARTALTSANEAISDLSLRLLGLEKKRDSLVQPLTAALEQLDRTLPAFAQTFVSAFTDRWNAARAEQFACIRMRAILENLLGPLDLTPVPVYAPSTEPASLDSLPAGLREVAAVQRQVRNAIDGIEAFAREQKVFADRRARARKPTLIQRTAVYRTRLPLNISGREMQAGEMALGLSLGPSADFYLERSTLQLVDPS